MTQQEFVDQKVRMTMGDLMVQIIVLQARIAELEAAQQTPEIVPPPKPNGEIRREKGAN